MKAIELEGKYGSAKVFTRELEDGAKNQIENLLDQEFVKGASVRIMPDVHQGKGSVIGFTADLKDKVIPNIVGVDIGCGVLTVELGDVDIDFKKLDKIVNKKVPSGRHVHNRRSHRFEKAKDLTVYRELKNTKRIDRSIGTLGGGNHFIEVGVDSKGHKFLTIHSGSRNLGNQIAQIHQRYAIELCSGMGEYYQRKEKLIEDYKSKGKEDKIKKDLKKLKREYKGNKPSLPRDLCYLTGKYKDDYIHDMKIAQEYASLNREIMAENILNAKFNNSLDDYPHFETVHNYIDFRDNIIRKGAIAAYEDERLLIPINMRDGSILGLGKGNEDWNYSAPHGAGRLMSRTEAKKKLSFDKFKKTMKDVYSSSVHRGTLDESPDAYRSMDEIIDSMGDAVEVVDILRPVYNFKA